MPATARKDKLATALMLSVAQIIEGSSACVGCEKDARFTFMTGADPEPEPVCYEHMALMMRVMQRSAAFIAGEPEIKPWEKP